MANITVSSATATVSGTAGDDIFSGSDGLYSAIQGQHTIIGGTGDDHYYVSSMSTTIVEQPNGGNDTVVSSSNYILPANVENLTIVGSRTGVGNDLDNVIQGFGGSTLDGGKGHDVLIGSGNGVAFQFDANSGSDLVAGWNSTDVLRLSGYSQFKTFADVQAAMHQSGSDVVLQLDASDSVVIQNAQLSALTTTNVQLPLSMAGMHLSFDDEFNTPLTVGQPGKGLDPAWVMQGQTTNAVDQHTLAGNGEKELYVDPGFKGTGSTALGLNPYSETNGVLSLTASPLPAADQAAAYNYKFQSGAINTLGTFSQTYGYFDARMKLPTGNGSWPAFWLLDANGNWPPELDVMEAWNDTTAVQTVHTAQTGTHTMASSSDGVPDGDTAFHDYGILWTPNTLTWYIDGVAVFTQPTPADMHSPMYMVIDNAVSGANTDPNYTGSLQVDYVRAYTLDSLPASVVTPDAATAAGVAAQTAASAALPATPDYGAVVGQPDGFNWSYYALHNPDVVAAGLNLLQHYQQYGKSEGRLAHDDGTGKESSIGTSGNDHFTAAAGVGHLFSGNGGSDIFTFVPGMRWDTITDFNVAHDTLDVSQLAAKYGAPKITQASFENAAEIQYSGGETILLMGVSVADATAAVAAGSHAPAPATTTTPVTTTTTPSTPATTTTVSTPATTNTPATTTSTATTGTAATTTTAPAHTYWGYDANEPDGFNAVYYLAHNPDVAKSGLNPLTHYEQYGKTEGRLPYDPAATAQSATAAWAADPTQPDGFNALYYLDHNADVAKANIDPLTHYEQYGKHEGRLAHAPDATATTTTTPPVSTAPVTTAPVANPATTPAYGAVAGQPDGFNTAYYALHNPDVVAAGVNLLQHFEQYGKHEGRLAYDDGTGKESSVGTSGNDHFTAPAAFDHLFTGGGGSDTFTFAPGIGWDTITDFDVAHDTLNVTALGTKYGAPTITQASFENAAEIHYSGGETILLLGVSVADAHHAVFGN